MRKLFVLSFVSVAALATAGVALAAPPSGVPAGGGGRPDFAGSGRPDFAGPSAGAGSSSSSGGYGSSASSNGASRGNSANAGSFPSTSNAGGRGSSHAAPAAQPALQVLDQAFSDGETSAIREYFTTRAHAQKQDGAVAESPYRRGQKLTTSYLAEPLPAELLAKLPNRPGLTYVRIGDDVLLLAGPDDVIVDVLTDVMPVVSSE